MVIPGGAARLGLGYGRCPLSCGAVPGWVVPWPAGGRFREPLAVRLGAHPNPWRPGPCIGSGQAEVPLPLAEPPLVSVGLSLQRAALAPAQGALFGEEPPDDRD